MLTPEEYIAKGGECCPACGSNNVTGFDIDFIGSTIHQVVMCNDCNGSWVDEYTLSGYDDFEPATVTNQYHCPDCDVTWRDTNCDSAHDDKCPVCNKAIEPETTEDE